MVASSYSILQGLAQKINRKNLLSRTVIVSLLFSCLASTVFAQAYCALRQPHRAQQILFPKSTQLETFTDEVTTKHRIAVQEELNFSIHKDELGLHTLYASFVDQEGTLKHLGYIHVRSEQGEWGLIEITWALYPDLTIKAFTFQRCRESAREEIQSEAFTKLIHKKTAKELRVYLNADGSALKTPLSILSKDAQSLGFRMIRSALKTIAVTRAVWPKVTSLK